MKLHEKLILTDCDGVLLDWSYGFDQWMKRHGYIKKRNDIYSISECYGITKSDSKRLAAMFNESVCMAYLPPLRDAMHYVKRLHEEHGFVFHCITALGTDPFAVRSRNENLRRIFGDTAIERITCIDLGASKKPILSQYENSGCLFVEDSVEHAEVGDTLGLNCVLMEHDHNLDSYNGNVPLVKNWKEIYHMMT